MRDETAGTMMQRRIEIIDYGNAFFAAQGLDVSHHEAMWHMFNLSHFMTEDLDAIARRHGISMAELHLLGALRIERPQPLRASDLVVILQVSRAVLSGRIARLEQSGLLTRQPSATDRRAHDLQLTEAGVATVDAVSIAIQERSSFVRHFNSLAEEDGVALSRILRDFSRGLAENSRRQSPEKLRGATHSAPLCRRTPWQRAKRAKSANC